MRCSATRRDGTPCQAPAVKGATVCRMHGGSAPQVRAAARRRVDDDAAATALAALIPDEPPPVRDPMGALAQLAGELVASREAAAGLVARLDAVADPAGNLAAEIRLWLALVDRSAKALIELAKLDVGDDGEGLGTDQQRALLAVVSGVIDVAPAEGRAAIMEALNGE